MDSSIIIILLFFALLEKKSIEIDTLHKVKNYAKDLNVDYKYTREKIKIFKNVLPYLPEDYIKTGGRSIIATEKILRVLETVDYVKLESEIPVEPLDLEPMERVYRIVNTLQDEISNSNIDRLGTLLGILVNKEDYMQLANLAMEFINNKDAFKSPKNITKLLEPLIGREELENSNLSRMMDIFNVLEPGKESKKDKDQVDNEQPKSST